MYACKEKIDTTEQHSMERKIDKIENSHNKLDEWIIPRDREAFYLTHDFHPYFAAFPPELTQRIIKKYSKKGNTVLDPFMGGGSAIVEAYRLNRLPIGIDISSLSKFITKVKVTPLKIEDDKIRKILDDMKNDVLDQHFLNYKNFSYHIPKVINIDNWFCRPSKYDLAIILHHINQIKNSKTRDFLKLAFSSILRKVSNAKNAEQHLNIKKEKKIPLVFPLFENKVKLMIPQMREYHLSFNKSQLKKSPRLYTLDIRNMCKVIDDDSIDLIITSPPYGTGSKYTNIYRFFFDWLELEKPNTKSTLESSKNFTEELKKGIEQMYKVLKHGKYCCIVYGDSSTDEITSKAIQDAISIGFQYKGLISCPIEKKKSKHHTKYRQFIPKDFILIFKK